MNKQRKTSHILNVFQYDDATGIIGLNGAPVSGYGLYLTTNINDGSVGIDSSANINALYLLKNSTKQFEISYDTSGATKLFRLLPYQSGSFFQIGNPSNAANSNSDYVFISEAVYGNVLIGPGIGNATGNLTGATASIHKVQFNGAVFANNSIQATSFKITGGASTGFLKADGTVDAVTYLSGNQSITVSGDATGSGTTSIALTLANTAVTPGTYGSTTLVPVVTVDSKGRITSVTTAAISGSLTFTGDVTGSGTTGTSTAMTLAASGVTAGTYTKVTVDTKGRVTVGASATTTDIAEGTRLYYTDARVLAYLGANNYATQFYVGTQIANLVSSAPATLDTLNELAAALGNDPSFATTTATSLGNRLRVDINTQGLSATLQGYGRTNLGLGTAATSNTGDFVAYRTFGTAANSATGDFVAYRTFGTAANNNTGDFALASHTHSIANVTGLQTALDGKQASGSYAASSHSHIISDVTGLQTALDGKQASLGFTPYNSTNPSAYIALASLSFAAGSGAYNNTTGVITIPTNNNQLTNGAGYITGYTETDTLASVTARGSGTSSQLALSSVTPFTMTAGGNTGTYTQTTWYFNQNNTSGDNANGIFIERGKLTDSGSGETRQFVIGSRGGSIQWRLDKDGNSYQTGTVNAPGATMTGDIVISGYRIKDLSSTNKGVYIGNWGGAGYWGLGSTANSHELKLDQVSSTTGFWEGATDVNLYLGSNRLVLHSSNYSSYALPLSGGIVTGTVTINGGAAHPLAISSGQRYQLQVRNTNNSINSAYGWWWFMDTNFNMGFHADGASDRFTLTRDGNLSVSGTVSGSNLSGTNTGDQTNISGNAARATRANGQFYIDDNYGNSIIGVYSSYRYQGVFSMGAAYVLPTDGTTTGNLYGLAWSHPNAGGVASNLNTHGLLVMENGTFLAAVSGSIRARDDMRAPIFYDSDNISYYGNFAGQSSMYGVAIRTDIAGSTDSGSQLFLYGAGNTTTSAIGFKNGGAFPNPTGNGDGWNTFFTMDTDGRGWVFRRSPGGSDFSSANTAGWILNNGIWQANAQMRAPQFRFTNSTNNTYLTGAGDWGFRAVNDNGYIQFGPANGSWSHIYSDKSFYFNQELYVNNQIVIHSGNIGSQSVSYAATAGNSNTVGGVSIGNIVRKDTTGQYLRAYYQYGSYLTSETPQTLVNEGIQGGGLRVDFMHPSYTGSGGWNHVITWSGYNGYNMYQLGGHYDGGTGTDLWVRSEANHGLSSWTAWRKLLNSSNYNSYSPTLTGGGASGTWGISISGSASSATTASTVTGASTMSGYLTVAANWGTSPYTSALTVIGTYPSMTFRGSNSDWEYLMHMDSAGDIQYYFGPGYTVNNWSQRYTFGRYGDFYVRTGTITASGDITAYSDIRVKENIEVIENALEKVKAIRGVTFNRTDLENDKGARHAGVIAQEVLEVLPEVVRTNDKGMYSVAYGNMVGLLIEGMKEQQLQIEELKNKLDNVLSSR